MAKPRAILKRRSSIQNIAKITKTMQMIATAKFKRANDRAIGARPYTDQLTALIAAEELKMQASADDFRAWWTRERASNLRKQFERLLGEQLPTHVNANVAGGRDAAANAGAASATEAHVLTSRNAG